jgi:hypothetical protein
MVTVRLIGGLGNQMFQYATGRAIAHRRQVPLALDLRAFPDHDNRNYSLDVFNIMAKLTDGGIMRLGRLRGLCSRVRIPGLPYVWLERGYTFDPSVLDAPGNLYLAGYWTTEKYFKDVEDILRKDFSFKNAPTDQNAGVADRIRSVNSVSVHVRRSDYVTNPVATQFHGTCSLDYYREAVGFIASRVTNPEYFVFSDDPDWTRENLRIDGPTTYVTHNTIDNGYEDLRLMTLCRNHIIANSTFSWWGAWLAAPGGLVVAPKRWMNNTTVDTKDVVPERWMRV